MNRLGAAALAGAACGLRTFSAPLALALRGRLDGRPARVLLGLAAAGELVGDKLPSVPSRTAPGPLALRLGAGALSGRALAGAPGLAAGVAGAAAGAFGGQRARVALTDRTGLPGGLLGAMEDAVAYAVALAATLPQNAGTSTRPLAASQRTDS
jgi:uncharacterized membrane protein